MARAVLDLNFPSADHDRFQELSAKVQEQELAPDEAKELDEFIHIDSLLAMLRLKAERSFTENDLRK